MRAIYIGEFGDLASVGLLDVKNAVEPGPDEALVRVSAAGLNRADLLQAKGLYPPPNGINPNIPGLEFAGEIAGLGKDVTGWKEGERVFGIAAGEAQAEYLITHSSLLARVPDNLSFTEAAAVPEAFITANDAVFTQAGLRSGESLLIHAVGSGVGLAALQLANAYGAFVIGTSRTAEKLERCSMFGLDASIVIGDRPVFADAVRESTGGKGADVILDLVGAAYFEQNLMSLASKGRLMLVGLTSGRKTEFDMGLALHKRATITGTVLRGRTTKEKAQATSEFVSGVVPLLEEGRVKPNVDKVFPAMMVREAYEYLASNESFGKVVLEF